MTVDNINWKCERRRDFLNAAYERNFIAKLDTLRKTRTLTYIGRRNVEN